MLSQCDLGPLVPPLATGCPKFKENHHHREEPSSQLLTSITWMDEADSVSWEGKILCQQLRPST